MDLREKNKRKKLVFNEHNYILILFLVIVNKKYLNIFHIFLKKVLTELINCAIHIIVRTLRLNNVFITLQILEEILFYGCILTNVLLSVRITY